MVAWRADGWRSLRISAQSLPTSAPAATAKAPDPGGAARSLALLVGDLLMAWAGQLIAQRVRRARAVLAGARLPRSTAEALEQLAEAVTTRSY